MFFCGTIIKVLCCNYINCSSVTVIKIQDQSNLDEKGLGYSSRGIRVPQYHSREAWWQQDGSCSNKLRVHILNQNPQIRESELGLEHSFDISKATPPKPTQTAPPTGDGSSVQTPEPTGAIFIQITTIVSNK